MTVEQLAEYAVSKNLTLTLTVDPDFGEVAIRLESYTGKQPDIRVTGDTVAEVVSKIADWLGK